FGILFGDLHAQKIAVEGGHTIDVANENAQVTEPDDTWHGAFATPGCTVQRSIRPTSLPGRFRAVSPVADSSTPTGRAPRHIRQWAALVWQPAPPRDGPASLAES